MKSKNNISVKLLSIVLICVMSITCMGAYRGERNQFGERNVEYLLDPNTNLFMPVQDITSNMKTKDMSAYISDDEKENFLLTKNKEQEISLFATPSDAHYIPYGYIYNDSFLNVANYGRGIAYDFICPDRAGGNVEDYLYLTATNSISHGVEAYISYYSQNKFEFKIFDWALSGAGQGDWALTLTYNQLSDYIKSKYINGAQRQVISVQNYTLKKSNGNWVNRVYLQRQDYSYDLVYQYEYSNSVAIAETMELFWGPIVEAMETNYTTLNQMGFNSTYLMEYSQINVNNGWSAMTSSEVSVRQDSQVVGITKIWSSGYNSFIVE